MVVVCVCLAAGVATYMYAQEFATHHLSQVMFELNPQMV